MRTHQTGFRNLSNSKFSCIFMHFPINPELIRPALIPRLASSIVCGNLGAEWCLVEKCRAIFFECMRLSLFFCLQGATGQRRGGRIELEHRFFLGGRSTSGHLKGRVRVPMYRHEPCAAIFSELPPNSPHSTIAVVFARNPAERFQSLVVGAVLFFLLLAAARLFAQQPESGDPGWAQNDPYNGQYAPNPQPDYGQPPEAQPAYPDSGQAYPQQGYGPTLTPAQPLNASQLERLVAPIALYPDALVAQVLAASTYPNQVADADQWRHAQGYSSPDQIAGGADVQSWDPSVKER